MSVERIERAADARLAAFRDLGDPERLRARGEFVAEGRMVVRRVIEDGRYRVRSVLVNEAARRDLAPALDTLPGDVPIFIGDASAFLEITGFDIHRGCLALVERPPAAAIDTLLATAPPLIVLEGVANADNVGSVFRNAAAFGAGGVILSPTCCDPLYRKAIRTSMGAVLRVPFARAGEWPAALDTIRAAGFTIVALSPREPSEPLEVFAGRARAPRVALVAGAEGAGLSADVDARADYRVRIPISDEVDSLNLAVAVGIALWGLRSSDPRI
jgi:tRNA G18 (ribose-2'-O)-methylase SpoU